MLEVSPRWTRQRLAVLEAVDCDLKRAFSVLYFVSGTSAGIYMAGWFRMNLLAFPVTPFSLNSALTIGVSAAAGVLFALLLPAIAVALGVERRLLRRMRQLDKAAVATVKHRLIAAQALPNYHEALGGTHGQHHHQKP
ncbi:hypothetical protein ACTTAK_13930 [Rhodobacter capsulatus]|uniref:hypothetical protein n=1 Tax=Rhodobacter capsulatus TaxID=1061 RepID=UPI00114179D1|nr:hypothetical protein [Rhodobacter capsulatus]TQD35581.1 hypothetical protein FKW81_08100 [Rhodobacter capsulatus]